MQVRDKRANIKRMKKKLGVKSNKTEQREKDDLTTFLEWMRG